jgi:tyrosyl-tRNA synthetase
VKQNAQGVRQQLSRFLDFDGPNAAAMVDNYDWTSRMSFIDWLRDVGKYFTVNYMVAKESVKSRMQSEQGISYTEFSYMTMQAYDFLHLYDTFGCRLQGGGSDQWGNITAGTDLIRRLRQVQAYGLTFPLITTASGAKFGKSAGNALWLEADRTPPWDLYQYLVRQDDRDVSRFLRIYTFLPEARLDELDRQTAEHPEQRAAQKALAYEVTAIVHGADIARELQERAQNLYSGGAAALAGSERAIAAEMPADQLTGGLDILDVMLLSGMVKSKGEGRRLLEGGGVYVNESRMSLGTKITLEHVSAESLIALRSGKKNYFLVRVNR